jgi:hypothetical protein
VNSFVNQEWNDSILQFVGLVDASYLELDSRMMKDVWVPDLYFNNEKSASFHDITVPNRMMHLYKKGRIIYRSR